MLAAFNISDDDISYAERILLPAGGTFDYERRVFIKNLDTLDLRAVPGSGKTTALLAKLLILDRKLPLPNEAGILVISHTNAAVNEIKERIGEHCINLFRYPNFVGTIQSFVDEFLAIPYYLHRFKKLPIRIDDDTYNQKFSNPPFYLPGKNFSRDARKRAVNFLIMNQGKKIRWSIIDGKSVLTDRYNGKPLNYKRPKGNAKNYKDWCDEEKLEVKEWIARFKSKILSDGFLCFDDAYFLADKYINENHQIKFLLEKRFPYVFVDEMQDMEAHQHNLLEKIFFDEGKSTVSFQRIGDKNQSIYGDSSSENADFWIDRTKVLTLTGSQRLNPLIARVVTPLAVTPIEIEGRNRNADGTEIAIKPHFIVFSDVTKEAVIPRFGSILKELIGKEQIPKFPNNKYKAVAWTTKKDEGKIRLCDYYPAYLRLHTQRAGEHPNLASHLVAFNRAGSSFASIEDSISNAFLRILREESIVDANGRAYTKRGLSQFLSEEKPEYWSEYRTLIYEWCVGVIQGNYTDITHCIRTHIPAFLAHFESNIQRSSKFINDDDTVFISNKEDRKAAQNVFRFDEDINIDIATIHSVKGETHTATLYLETAYQRGGGGQYESERLIASLKGRRTDLKTNKFLKQSAYMAYVGFSRPTHLLCFAVHESRFEKLEDHVIEKNNWEIVRVRA